MGLGAILQSDEANRQWTAVILAGQRPGTDPLAAHFDQEFKALVPLEGEAMLTHVVRILNSCSDIGRIVVLSQNPQVLEASVASGGGGQLRASNDGISTSLLALLGSNEVDLPWLVTTADHPLLSQQMISEFVEESGGDLSVAMVERQTMLAQFPGAKRTWLRFSDGGWSGANLFAFRSSQVRHALELWAAAEKDRKQVWKLFLHFGPYLALRAITRTISIRRAFELAGKKLGLDARLVSMSDPVAAIDVDKPSDHALATEIFAKRRGL